MVVLWLTAQVPSPADAESWAKTIEHGGIIGLLVIFVLLLGWLLFFGSPKVFVPGWRYREVVEELKDTKEQLAAAVEDRRDLERILGRSVDVTERMTTRRR